MSAAHRDEIAKLESLYAENPEGRVFTHLAEAYRKAGELDRAREILSNGIERHPDYSSAHVVLGRVLMDQGEGQEADAAFERVLELDPHNLIAIRSRADIARDRGDDESARELYNRLLDQEPGDDEVRQIVEGMSQDASALAQEPVDAFPSDTIDEDGDDAELRTETIAQVYARQGLYDRAAEVYRELSRARPDEDSLKERLAEMEQLAAAQSESDEVDAVSDFDAPSTAAPSPATDDEPWDDAPWSESQWGEPDQTEEESPWSSSAPEPEGSESADQELGEMPEAGPYHDQWRTEGDEEPEPEGHPEVFRVEGLESSEVDPSEAEVEQLADIEVDEMDPETGLRAGNTPDTAAPGEDLSDEMDVRDVPEPPAEQPWEPEAGADDAPSWLSAVGMPETDASLDAEEEAVESVWAGSDWEDDTDEETTPHAWTEEDDEDRDTSPPVREYFGGLLGWSGAEAGQSRQDEDQASAVSETPELPGAAGPTGAAAELGEDDDDLDMFRSWLESLKQ